MLSPEAHYLPLDRLRALAAKTNLPTNADGSVLFADLSGFTRITERLRRTLGVRRGAEMLAAHLNRVYGALIAAVERKGGSIVSFAGDAMTIWFSGVDAPIAAVGCAFDLMDAIESVERIPLSDGETVLIGLKVSIATGAVRRFVVGSPQIQLIDVVVGAAVNRVALGEGIAERGDIVADTATIERLYERNIRATIREWRTDDTDTRFAILEAFPLPELAPLPSMDAASEIANPESLRAWLLPAVVSHFEAGLGEYLTELRPAVALFIHFTGIDYEGDSDAGSKLDAFVRFVQEIVARMGGIVLQATVGDKGSYLYAAFGAPSTHEDDAARALNAALDIRAGAVAFDYLEPLQIGISRGEMRTGAYGSETRRTYGVLGDEVNVAARLMMHAAPDEILISESLLGAKLDDFDLEGLPPISVKGKTQPISILRLVGRREPHFAARFYTTPLIGREDELAVIQASLEPIFAGRHAGIIYIYGEAGMGKSRLAFEAQSRIQRDHAVTWLTGQAESLDRSSFSAVNYFLRPYFGQRRDQNFADNLAAFDKVFDALLSHADEADRAELKLYGSYLAGIVGLTLPDSPYAAAGERLRIDNGIAALKAWARAESKRQPLIIHLEDAHWLDASSIRVVQNLTYNMNDVPLALLLTSRYNDDGTPFTIPEIFDIPVHPIDLSRLNDRGIETVITAVLGGGREISASLAQFVRERAEGNPFFTEQLALDLKERNALIESENGWDIQPNAAAEVPSGVNAVLIARLDRLAVKVKVVVQTASVLGREFDVHVLSNMLREEDRESIRIAEDESIWTAVNLLRYLFRHVLFRDAAYQMQVEERLKALHRLAAETIEALYPDDETQDDVLLEHWHVAGDIDRELFYLRRVARRLIDTSAQFTHAEMLLKRALRVLSEDDPRRIAPLNLLGLSQQYLGNLDASHAAATEALQLAQLHQDSMGIAESLNSLGNIAQFRGNYAAAHSYFEQSLAIRREVGEQRAILKSLQQVANMVWFEGDYEKAQQLYEELVRLNRASGDRSGEASALNGLGIVALRTGRHEDHNRYQTEALAISREIGERRGIFEALNSLGVAFAMQGDYATARTYIQECLDVCREIGYRSGSLYAANNLGLLAQLEGDYVSARSYYHQSLEIARAIGNRYYISITLNNLGVLAFQIGDDVEAEAYCREALALRRNMSSIDLYASLGWLTRILLRMGRHDEARSTLREGIQTVQEAVDPQKLMMLVSAVDWYAVTGKIEAAAELGQMLIAHPANDAEFRGETEKILERIRPQVDAKHWDAVLERGKTLDIDQVIEQLLAELA